MKVSEWFDWYDRLKKVVIDKIYQNTLHNKNLMKL